MLGYDGANERYVREFLSYVLH